MENGIQIGTIFGILFLLTIITGHKIPSVEYPFPDFLGSGAIARNYSKLLLPRQAEVCPAGSPIDCGVGRGCCKASYVCLSDEGCCPRSVETCNNNSVCLDDGETCCDSRKVCAAGYECVPSRSGIIKGCCLPGYTACVNNRCCEEGYICADEGSSCTSFGSPPATSTTRLAPSSSEASTTALNIPDSGSATITAPSGDALVSTTAAQGAPTGGSQIGPGQALGGSRPSRAGVSFGAPKVGSLLVFAVPVIMIVARSGRSSQA